MNDEELSNLVDMSEQLADRECSRCGSTALTLEGHSGPLTPYVTVTCTACDNVVLFKNPDGRINFDAASANDQI